MLEESASEDEDSRRGLIINSQYKTHRLECIEIVYFYLIENYHYHFYYIYCYLLALFVCSSKLLYISIVVYPPYT